MAATPSKGIRHVNRGWWFSLARWSDWIWLIAVRSLLLIVGLYVVFFILQEKILLSRIYSTQLYLTVA